MQKNYLRPSKTSDLILMILDATKRAEQRALLEAELEAVGIRLNREAPWVPCQSRYETANGSSSTETSTLKQRKPEG